MWGVPPWQVEEESTQLWWDRWLAWEDEKAAARKEKAANQATTRQAEQGAAD